MGSHHRSSVVVSSSAEHHHGGDAAMVSLRPPDHHPWVPLGPGFLPVTTFSGESSLAGRNPPVEPHQRRGGIKSPISVYWAGSFLLGGLRALWIEPGCKVMFIIFHPIYSNQFNSSQIQIWFELWKFVEA
jgi:hypothetical protein